MEPNNFAEWIATLGVGGLIAVIIYYQGRKDAQMYADQLKSLLEVERGRTEMLVSVIRDNTAALVRNTTVSEAFHKRLDTEERRGS